MKHMPRVVNKVKMSRVVKKYMIGLQNKLNPGEFLDYYNNMIAFL